MSRRFPDNVLGLGYDEQYELDTSRSSRYPPLPPGAAGAYSPSLDSVTLTRSPPDDGDHFARYPMPMSRQESRGSRGSAEKGLERQFDSDRDLVARAGVEEVDGEGEKIVPRSRGSSRRKWWIVGGVVALLVVVGAVVGGVVGSRKGGSSQAGAGAGAGAGGGSGTSGGSGTETGMGPAPIPSTPPVLGGSGVSGSEVTTDLGAKFMYVNDFGGSWAYDPASPFSVSGQAQSWTPKINEAWTWGKDIVRGVNLGGWLVTEPFIVPALYEPYQDSSPKAIDEYTLSQAMGKDLASKMEEHYRTFITEKDFADIAAAGLNWVRVPIGYWAVGTEDDEPFLPKVSWGYFVKAVTWARKYGLRVQLDFHALPGSQNGWNHSGKAGDVNWMRGVMGIANAQRHLEYIRSLAQFISQDGIKQVVPMFGIVNEVQTKNVGLPALQSFYREAYKTVRSVSGFGTGNGPILAIHEGFEGIGAWKGYLAGADRLALDQHPYLAFGGANTNPWSKQIEIACGWGGGTNDSQRDFGIVIGGEWSNAINDCGLWLNGVGSVAAYDSLAPCKAIDEWMTWDDTMKQNVMGYTMANMDSLQNWFFWTWHIGNSTVLGYPSSPLWHYKLGLEQGWMPKDPRAAGGYCKRNGYCPGCYEFDGNFPASATGAVASPTIAPVEEVKYPWPPASMLPESIGAQVALLPTLTQTGTPVTLVAESASAWAAQDTAGAYTKVQGCTYPNAYPGDIAIPTKCA